MNWNTRKRKIQQNNYRNIGNFNQKQHRFVYCVVVFVGVKSRFALLGGRRPPFRGIISEVRSLQKIYIWLSRFPQFSRIRISGSPSKKKTSKKYTFRFYQNKTLFKNTKNSKIAGIPRLPKQNRYLLSIFTTKYRNISRLDFVLD